MNKPLKAKKCRHCKQEFIPRVSLQRVCSLPCALEYSRRPAKVRRSASEALQRKIDREAMDFMPVTRQMTKKQGTEYIDTIIREFSKQGYSLIHPSEAASYA